MSPEEFRRSATGAAAALPPGLTPPLQALWHDAHGAWDRAHASAQEEGSRDGAWVHAYLHRREGDVGNAGYWYRRAGRTPATGDLAEEWSDIARTLLAGA